MNIIRVVEHPPMPLSQKLEEIIRAKEAALAAGRETENRPPVHGGVHGKRWDNAVGDFVDMEA